MQVDRYTRGVLTVIAVALCVLVVQNAASPAGAQTGNVQRVVICDVGGFTCADVSALSRGLVVTPRS